MNNNYPQIQELLHQRADFQARLNLLPYDGTPKRKVVGSNPAEDAILSRF